MADNDNSDENPEKGIPTDDLSSELPSEEELENEAFDEEDFEDDDFGLETDEEEAEFFDEVFGEEVEEMQAQVESAMKTLYASDLDDPLALIEKIYYLWTQWADFHLVIIDPPIEEIIPPTIVAAELLDETTGEKEHVYTILDHGNRLSTSRADDMYAFGISMCKMHITIEKMIAMLHERMQTGGIDEETEVQVAFSGHEFAQRKAFEVIINLPGNVVVTNFEPGEWGEKYLDTVKKLADMGYGYPAEAPRDSYKKTYNPESKGLGSK